ncbi:nicotinamidase-related amidase [Phytomonospora endophytica]|uniref:Nicotinamidase-related amidase n=1 Tax=Phytomonospora endophytica TaxID=714109 RepID=A0A841FHD8_9ACTN|nr:cysteine hydrolase family protein [Phytomonospora endophytica]MBB6033258.1 nicotinamidase-related amidase [Phytomonospora endophytica]
MNTPAAPVQALLVIDVQHAGVTGDGAVPAARTLLAAVATLLDRARAAGVPVVHVQNDGKPGEADEPGTPGWQLRLPVADGETVLRKTRADSFEGTSLRGFLSGHGVASLAVCGVMSDVCVSATARTALDLGYRVVLPHDAHATQDIPAVPWLDEVVPAAVAARAAEWALSTGAEITASAAEVVFERAR